MTSHTSAKFHPLSLIGAELYARHMDFELPGEDDPRRREIREWLEHHRRPTGRQLAEAGYVAPHWPKPYGLGADPVHQLIVDDELRRAGVSRPVNPIGVGWAGLHTFNEVFFDDVRIPAENVVGEENRGWALAKVTLSNERVSLSSGGVLWGNGPTAFELVDLVRNAGGVYDPLLRQRLAAIYCEAEVLRLIRLRTVTAAVQGRPPGPEASVRKALADEHGQHVMGLAKDLAGTAGLLSTAGPLGERDGSWNYGFLFAPALTVGGGTSEVQRNIIGERVRRRARPRLRAVLSRGPGRCPHRSWGRRRRQRRPRTGHGWPRGRLGRRGRGWARPGGGPRPRPRGPGPRRCGGGPAPRAT